MLAYIDYLIFRFQYFLKRGRGRPEHELAIRRLYGERVGLKRVKREKHFSVLSYEHDGAFDYDLYKRVQTEGNKGKIGQVFVREDNIRHLCRKLEARIPSIEFVLCHGTRNAAEQKYFQATLSKSATILGTEISDTAAQYPMTIEWDFHETKPEWIGAADVVYSNSWDHSYDPRKLFAAWLSCLRPHGIMVLEWTHLHGGRANPSILDPLNVPLEGLVPLLDEFCSDGRFKLVEIADDLPVRNVDQTFVLVQRIN